MADILYTNTDAILSCIGVRREDLQTEPGDLGENILLRQGLEVQMRLALEKAFPGYDSANSAVYGDVLALWCMWYGAMRVCEMPYAFLKRYTTGKDEGEKFDIDWGKMMDMCASKMGDLENSFPNTSLAPVNFFSTVSPSFNPITG